MTYGAWIAARCVATDHLLSDEELAAFAKGTPGDRFRIRPSRIRFAHTSPIYVRVSGRSAAVAASVHEGLRMLDRFEDFTRAGAAAQYRDRTLNATAKARRRLRQKL